MKKRSKAQALSISIVIPVYNEEGYLKACLDSIAKQTVQPDEVIVVDNNSTDNTVKLVKNYSFVKLIYEKRQGVLYASRKGFDTARCDIIGRIDADTRLLPDWVAHIKDVFSTDKEITAVSGAVSFYDVPVPRLGLFIDKSMRKIMWRIGVREKAVFLSGSNMALRRKAWQDIRTKVCERRDIHEDLDLAIHLYNAGYVVAFDENLVAMISLRRIDDSTKELYKYLQANCNTYKIHNIKHSAMTFAAAVLLPGQHGVKLIRRFYDPKTRRFSLKKFLNSNIKARIHPMG